MFRLSVAPNVLLAVSLVQLLLIVRPVRNEDPDKWVWSGDRADNDGGLQQPRYAVYENHDEPSYGRPTFGVQGGVAGIANRPNRPAQGFYNPQRPTGIYGQGGFRPPASFKPGNNYDQVGNFGILPVGPQGVLTGPSFGKERPFKYFDKCKCTERFNCESHGVAYGHCDVGKQYCCYGKSGPEPSRNVHSSSNGVLLGPDGPYDKPNNPGVLVGPGGPTGIIGRPPRPNGNSNHYSNGVLVGPGGPVDGLYDVRSSNN